MRQSVKIETAVFGLSEEDRERTDDVTVGRHARWLGCQRPGSSAVVCSELPSATAS